MIKIIFTFFLLIFLFLNPTISRCQEPTARGLFIWSLEEHPVLSSKMQIEEAVNFAKKHNIKTLFVQVYRANQAFFPSKIAEVKVYLFMEKGRDFPIDSFTYLINLAHANGVEVHAWLNLLSLSGNKDAKILKKYGPSILTRNVQKKRILEDYKIDNQYFLEPSDPRVRQELLILVGDLLRAYPDLDGIQFDYIRYPDVHPFYGYSKDNIESFKKATGLKKIVEENPQWKQWKRDQVTQLLEMLVKKVRSIRPQIHVSTTGCLAYSRAYDEALQDWPSWLKNNTIEFVTLMNYPPDAETFQKNITDIKIKILDFSKVNMAVGAYKEIQTVSDFKGQADYCELSGAKSCVFFHYDALIQKSSFVQVLEKSEGSR